jgi:PIN domain nuclease of toxin-antitoxin system
VGGFALILLDTHVLVWAVAEPARLSPAALEAIERFRKKDGLADCRDFIVGAWNALCQRTNPGFCTIDASIRLIIEGITVKPITPEIVAVSTQFPPEYPFDPADRLIGATVRTEGLALVTR